MKKILPFKWFIYVSLFLCALALIAFFALSKVDEKLKPTIVLLFYFLP